MNRITRSIPGFRESLPDSNKRGYTRHCVQMPITFQMPFSTDFQQGVVGNVCKDGMYFETRFQIRPDTHLYVKRDPMEGVCDVQTHPVYMTSVRWMRPCAKGGMAVFGSGVQYTLKGHLFVSDCPKETYVCDFCGKRCLNEIHVTEDQTFFCEDCFKKIGGLDNARIRECLLRYSMGNVC